MSSAWMGHATMLMQRDLCIVQKSHHPLIMLMQRDLCILNNYIPTDLVNCEIEPSPIDYAYAKRPVYHGQVYSDRPVYYEEQPSPVQVSLCCSVLQPIEEIRLKIFGSPDWPGFSGLSFEGRGLCLLPWKLVWMRGDFRDNLVWMLRGLPWKLVWNLGSRHYLQSDLLRARVECDESCGAHEDVSHFSVWRVMSSAWRCVTL